MKLVNALPCSLLLVLMAAFPGKAQASIYADSISFQVAHATAGADKSALIWFLTAVVGILGTAVLTVMFLLSREWRAPVNTELPASEIAPILFIQRGSQAGKTIILNKIPCAIGQDADNDICLKDPKLSQHHAKILAFNDGYGVVDLGSKEGTFVNGQAIQGQPAPLRAGDIIRFGEIVMIFGN